MKYAVMNLSKNEHLERPYFDQIHAYESILISIRRQEKYLKVIHTLGYEIISLKQLSASACFKTIVKTRYSTGIKQALGVNRYKRMGTGLKRI